MQNSFDKIPDGFLKKWQETADLIAAIMHVPAALIMKTENEMMEVFTSSNTESNPYKVGDKEHWHGLYCETVIKTQQKLHIPNALKDKKWDKNPDIKLGMIAYLGYPINFPDNTPFGTICVLDNKERRFSAENEKLLLQFKKVIELDLALIFSLELKEKFSHTGIIQKLSLEKEELFKARQKAKENEERFRVAQEMSPDGFTILHPVRDDKGEVVDFTWVYENQAIARINETDPQDVIGKKLLNLFPSHRGTPVFESYRHVTNSGETQILEDVYVGEILSKPTWLRLVIVSMGEDIAILTQNITDRKQAEMRLRESEQLLNETGKIARVGGWELDAQTKKVSWTEETYRLHEVPFDYAPPLQEAITFFHPKDRGKLTDAIEHALEKGEPYDLELRFITTKGKQLWTRTVCEPEFINGKVVKLKGIIHDITDRKKAEEALRANEEHLRITLNSIGDAVITTDVQGRVLNLNPAAETLTGWDVAEACQKPLEEVFIIINAQTGKTAPNPVHHVLKTGKIVGLANHTKLIAKNGTEYQIADSAAPILGKDGQIRGVVLVFRDVTKEYQMRESLRESEEKYRRIADNVTDVVWITDLEMNPTYISPSVERVFGVKPEEYLNLPISKTYPPASLEKLQKRLTEELMNEQDPEADKNRFFRLEVERYYTDGTIGWDAISAKFIRDEQMNPVAIQGVSRDITEQKKTEEALQRIEWMLRKKSAADKNDQAPPYGDLSELNTNGLVLDAVGKNVLKNIADDFLRLLETSSAIYEKNGDYALGIFASGWCRFMDQASRELCETDNNIEALSCGKWLCHDSCWKEASLPAIESGKPVDIECKGGIHLYALPIVAGDEIVGAINFGYGDPPKDKEKLSELAEKYKVPLDELEKKAKEYQSRPPYIIETAKDRLQASANLIGEIVSRKTTEKEIIKLNEQLEQKVAEKTKELKERVSELERFHDATVEREFRIKELREEIERLKRKDTNY